jgi:hypothetical protein
LYRTIPDVATEGVVIAGMAIAALNWWAALAPIRAVKNEIAALAAAASE